MLSIVMPQGVSSGNMVCLAVNEAVTKHGGRSMHTKKRVADPLVRDMMTSVLQRSKDHVSSKVGEDLEDGSQQSIELLVGQLSGGCTRGDVVTGDSAIGLLFLNIDGFAGRD